VPALCANVMRGKKGTDAPAALDSERRPSPPGNFRSKLASDMTIKRLPKSPDIDEMPPAKIYLDEVRQIVDALSTPDSDRAGEPASVKFRLRGLECDTVEELEQLGGRARRFEIQVQNGYRTSTLRSKGYGTQLWLSGPESDFWRTHGKIKRILESNAIPWKNVANECLKHPSFYFWFPTLLLIADIATYHFLTSAALRKTERELYYAVLAAYVVGVSVYQFLFAGSVLILHYSHTKGVRKWFEAHGAQILLVVLGVVLKLVGDWIWHRLQGH
jgi:hypothetical protein